MPEKIVTLDVREDIRNGREPFSKIMSAVAELHADENLLLLAPFEPKPLFGLLTRQGFNHLAREMENGDWEILFSRSRGDEALIEKPEIPKPKTDQSLLTSAPTKMIEVDARGLEPPQPMVKILETLASLPHGAALRARTDRRPMHLYAQLEARGFTGQTEEQNDGSFLTIIKSR
ncbi:MAG TPA: DUF2249 domain-containing protein [Verrucomicrobiae bacterium]|nr:DUF2249 domain-containing protein [Verrucomicrobiae bacterium]